MYVYAVYAPGAASESALQGVAPMEGVIDVISIIVPAMRCRINKSKKRQLEQKIFKESEEA
jgi:hypothetical protein